MTHLHYSSLLDVAAQLRTRDLSAVELTEAMLNRVEHLQPSLHAYATKSPELALRQARAADAEIAAGRYRGPLHGIPVAVKDICATAGIATAAGMPIHANHRPADDATVVRRLADAGAVLLGKLQLTEGAFAKHHPQITVPRNPWNAGYYAGASSSGSGVATAAGMCFGALGSDTGGSIRFPASANGVTGLKPTWGRVSRYGVFPLAPSLDHVGPFARTAADAGAILGAIAGADPLDPTTLQAPVPDYLAKLDHGLRGLCIGIDASYNETGADAAIVAMLHDAADVLKDAGATLVDVSVPDPCAIVDEWATCAGVEASLVHEATFPSRRSEYGPAVSGSIAALIEHGRGVSATDLMRAHHARLAFTGALAALLTRVDLLLIPAQPLADFTLEQEERLFASPEALAAFLRFATPFDMSGSPTITLPSGFTARGMPVAFQFVAPHLGEAQLIRAGHAWQQATDWHRRYPPV
ncbi:Amidase [Burkholderia sp. H160]|nr:Amidase [Burkholderia sp. H160]